MYGLRDRSYMELKTGKVQTVERIHYFAVLCNSANLTEERCEHCQKGAIFDRLLQPCRTSQENIVNRLQRQLEGVLLNFRMLEQKLEARGLNLKELGITTGELGSE